MNYVVLITLHLFAAFIFVGTVFFEVLMLEGVRKHVPHEAMRAVEKAIGRRAREVAGQGLEHLLIVGEIKLQTRGRSIRHSQHRLSFSAFYHRLCIDDPCTDKLCIDGPLGCASIEPHLDSGVVAGPFIMGPDSLGKRAFGPDAVDEMVLTPLYEAAS